MTAEIRRIAANRGSFSFHVQRAVHGRLQRQHVRRGRRPVVEGGAHAGLAIPARGGDVGAAAALDGFDDAGVERIVVDVRRGGGKARKQTTLR